MSQSSLSVTLSYTIYTLCKIYVLCKITSDMVQIVQCLPTDELHAVACCLTVLATRFLLVPGMLANAYVAF